MKKNKDDGGKWVLITGGTKGIGKAVAGCLAKAGYSLVLTYASDKEEAIGMAADLMRQYKVEARTLQADIADRKSIEKIESFLNGCALRLDAVVFNAGLTCRDPFEQLDMAQWERVFFANVHFPVFLLQRIVGLINKGGSIVFTGSLMGIQPHSVFIGIRCDEECRACVGEEYGEVLGSVRVACECRGSRFRGYRMAENETCRNTP